MLLFSLPLQDEKNEVMITNVWIRQVSRAGLTQYYTVTTLNCAKSFANASVKKKFK